METTVLCTACGEVILDTHDVEYILTRESGIAGVFHTDAAHRDMGLTRVWLSGESSWVRLYRNERGY